MSMRNGGHPFLVGAISRATARSLRTLFGQSVISVNYVTVDISGSGVLHQNFCRPDGSTCGGYSYGRLSVSWRRWKRKCWTGVAVDVRERGGSMGQVLARPRGRPGWHSTPVSRPWWRCELASAVNPGHLGEPGGLQLRAQSTQHVGEHDRVERGLSQRRRPGAGCPRPGPQAFDRHVGEARLAGIRAWVAGVGPPPRRVPAGAATRRWCPGERRRRGWSCLPGGVCPRLPASAGRCSAGCTGRCGCR